MAKDTKKYCSERCRHNTWALRRAVELLAHFSAARKSEILAGLLRGNQR